MRFLSQHGEAGLLDDLECNDKLQGPFLHGSAIIWLVLPAIKITLAPPGQLPLP